MLRNYFCPKCGAVADVRWWAAHTQAEYDAFWADYERRKQRWIAERETHKWKHFRPSPYWNEQLAEALDRGVTYGEHLAASCPRCTHRWVEPVLAATEATPLFDEVVAIFGRQAERMKDEVR